jgi:hypothetical protein
MAVRLRRRDHEQRSLYRAEPRRRHLEGILRDLFGLVLFLEMGALRKPQTNIQCAMFADANG